MKIEEVFRVLPLDKNELLYDSVLKFLKIEDIVEKYDIEDGEITIDNSDNVVITLNKTTDDKTRKEIEREFETRSKYFMDVEVREELIGDEEYGPPVARFMFVIDGEKGRRLKNLVNQILDTDDPNTVIEIAKEIVRL